MIDTKDEDIILACSIANSMAEAARLCEMSFTTFKRNATRLGVYNTNQGGVGIKKDRTSTAIPIEEILQGFHPQFQSYKLKHKLYKAGIKTPKCEKCGLGQEWGGSPIEHHLDHVNGNSSDHRLENLMILCPNCHSQTATYTGKNKGRGKEI